MRVDLEEFPVMKPELIILAVSKALNIPIEVIKGKSRLESIVDARMICVGLILNANPNLSLTTIGSMFGNRHHTTISNNRDNFSNLLGSNWTFTNKVIKVRDFIN